MKFKGILFLVLAVIITLPIIGQTADDTTKILPKKVIDEINSYIGGVPVIYGDLNKGSLINKKSDIPIIKSLASAQLYIPIVTKPSILIFRRPTGYIIDEIDEVENYYAGGTPARFENPIHVAYSIDYYAWHYPNDISRITILPLEFSYDSESFIDF